MKLELKHWSAYLPYELKIQLGDGEIKTVIAIKDWVGWCVTYKSKYGETNIGLNSAKPILRPLSDLTKEIEHNGEMFVPCEVLQRICSGSVDWACKERNYWIKKYGHEKWLNAIPYDIVQKLLEWHFDIFGLIENDLAVDINTLSDDHATL